MTFQQELEARIMQMAATEIVNRNIHNQYLQRCDECNGCLVVHSWGAGYEDFLTCKNRKCGNFMGSHNKSLAYLRELAIQDNGSGNQVIMDGRCCDE